MGTCVYQSKNSDGGHWAGRGKGGGQERQLLLGLITPTFTFAAQEILPPDESLDSVPPQSEIDFTC